MQSLGFLILFDFGNIVRGALVYEVVEPVGKEQMCVSAPAHDRRLFRVVIFKVVDGAGDRLALR